MDQRQKERERKKRQDNTYRKQIRGRNSQVIKTTFLFFPLVIFSLAWPPPARFNFLIEEIWFLERCRSLLWLHRITMFKEEREADGWKTKCPQIKMRLITEHFRVHWESSLIASLRQTYLKKDKTGFQPYHSSDTTGAVPMLFCNMRGG